jgi:hypothetical protein
MIEIKLTPDKMHVEVERLVTDCGLDYIDALLYYAEKNGLEVETVASMVKSNAKIKAKVRIEGETLNFLPKTARLPI